MVLFDQAFDTIAARRFQSARELSERIVELGVPVGDLDDDANLLAHFEEVAARPRPDGEALTIVRRFADRAEGVARHFASRRRLNVDHQRYNAEPGWVDLALVRLTTTPPPYTKLRFEMRGSTEVALVLEGEVLWSGSDHSAAGLEAAIQRPLIEAFLAHYGGDAQPSDATD